MISAFPPASSGFSSSPQSPLSASGPSQVERSSSATSSGEILKDLAPGLRDRIHRIERSLEDALAEGGALVGDLVRARRSLGLSTIVGQPVFAAIVETLDAAAVARGKSIQAHKLLDRMGQALRMDDSDYGDAGKDPFTGTFTTGRIEAPAVA